MALHRDPRVTVLAAVAGFLVSYDRQVLQYQRYWWDSVADFLISWFLHYIAVILVAGVAYAIARGNVSFLLGQSARLRDLMLEEAMIYGFIIVIVAAVAIFVITHVVLLEMD